MHEIIWACKTSIQYCPTSSVMWSFLNSLKSNIQYATLKTLSLVSISIMSPQQSIKELFRNADCVCFDVDSTVIKDEGIDELARFCGKGEEVKRLWVCFKCFIRFRSSSRKWLSKKLKKEKKWWFWKMMMEKLWFSVVLKFVMF